MLKEIEYELDGHTYLISQLPLGKSQEVLLRVTKMVDMGEGLSFASITKNLSSDDVNYFRKHLLGQYCQLKNESGHWVPLGEALVETHFAGRLGALFHILAKCLVHNYSDFLADLRLEELLGAMDLD